MLKYVMTYTGTGTPETGNALVFKLSAKFWEGPNLTANSEGQVVKLEFREEDKDKIIPLIKASYPNWVIVSEANYKMIGRQ